MLYSIYFKMVLITDKSEVMSEGHNEFLYVLYNLLLDHTLIYIFNITFANFLYI